MKLDPAARQYVVVANARAYNSAGKDVPLLALVKTAAAAGDGSPMAKAWVHDPDSDEAYDDVAVAVSSKTGSFLLVAERKATGEGEATVGALYTSTGTRLTPPYTRLDLLQSIGNEVIRT